MDSHQVDPIHSTNCSPSLEKLVLASPIDRFQNSYPYRIRRIAKRISDAGKHSARIEASLSVGITARDVNCLFAVEPLILDLKPYKLNQKFGAPVPVGIGTPVVVGLTVLDGADVVVAPGRHWKYPRRTKLNSSILQPQIRDMTQLQSFCRTQVDLKESDQFRRLYEHRKQMDQPGNASRGACPANTAAFDTSSEMSHFNHRVSRANPE